MPKSETDHNHPTTTSQRVLAMMAVITRERGHREVAMPSIGKYDGELQMFCEPAREPDVARLGFLRWLVEHGQLEHDVVGRAADEYAGVGVAERVSSRAGGHSRGADRGPGAQHPRR